MRFEILYNPKIKSPSPCWVWRDDCIFWATALLIALQQRIHPMPGTDPAFVDISFVAAVSACCRCPYSRDTPRGGLWITLSNQKKSKTKRTCISTNLDYSHGTFWPCTWYVLVGGTFWLRGDVLTNITGTFWRKQTGTFWQVERFDRLPNGLGSEKFINTIR